MQPKKRNIFSLWVEWHFIEMPEFLFLIWKNYLIFAAEYFSVSLLLKTFFSPWKKYNWRYPKIFSISVFLNTLVSNIFSRFLGAIVRSGLVIMGAIVQTVVFMAGVVVFILWEVLPLLIILGFIYLLYV